MGFERDRLPDPVCFYGIEGLKLEGGGKWRTTSCVFHGGSDSMRINTATGAWVCMAGCGARGGDVLAYHMAAHGLGFVDAAKALGAWVEDGRPEPRRRPTPISPGDALQVLASETNLAAVAAANVAHGVALTRVDLERLLQAASRIAKVSELFA